MILEHLDFLIDLNLKLFEGRINLTFAIVSSNDEILFLVFEKLSFNLNFLKHILDTLKQFRIASFERLDLSKVIVSWLWEKTLWTKKLSFDTVIVLVLFIGVELARENYVLVIFNRFFFFPELRFWFFGSQISVSRLLLLLDILYT